MPRKSQDSPFLFCFLIFDSNGTRFLNQRRMNPFPSPRRPISLINKHPLFLLPGRHGSPRTDRVSFHVENDKNRVFEKKIVLTTFFFETRSSVLSARNFILTREKALRQTASEERIWRVIERKRLVSNFLYWEYE